MSACICAKRTVPPPESWNYPEWKEGADNLAMFQKHGYFIARGLISNQEVEATKEAVSDIVQEWFAKARSSGEDGKDWEEIANRFSHTPFFMF